MKLLKFFKNMNKKQKVIFYSSVSALILALIIGGYFFFSSSKESKILGEFKLKTFHQDVKNANDLNTLEFEASENATNYKVYIYNNKNKLLKEIETKKNTIKIDNLDIEYDEEVTIKVVAFDKNGNKLRAKNELKINWALPSLQQNEINDIGVDEDLSVRINIDEDNMEGYYLLLTKGDEEVLKLAVDSYKMIIPSNYYKNNLGKYVLSLITNDIVLSSYEFNVGLPEIGEISIDSINHNSTIPWDDFEITFSGGENADLYEISIFKDNKMIFFKQLPEMTYKMDITQLEENNTYVLKVMAYNKIDNTINNQKVLSFKTGAKQKAEKVSADPVSGDIYIGNSVTLTSSTTTADIYYTTDGTTPSENSLKYSEPLKITVNTTIKAIAIAKNHFNSDVTEFSYKAIAKPIAVYISPSLQTGNKGIQSVGYTNESAIMNQIADVVESGLKAKGITVYRSKSTMNIDEVVADSKSKKVDLHLSLHSNASDDGTVTGIETYAYSAKSAIAPLASKIQTGLEEIYYKTNPRTIKYQDLKEVNPEKVDNGILVEVAYHDNLEDATWIMNKITDIGNKFVDVIAKYFGK